MGENYLLPPPKPVDVMGSIGRGAAIGNAMGQYLTKDAMDQQKLNEMYAQRNALDAYGQTGDINNLIAGNPAMASKVMEAQTHQQKQLSEGYKGALDYMFMNVNGFKDPQTYSSHRDVAVKMFPPLAGQIPEQWNESIPGLADGFVNQYREKMKLNKTLSPYEAGRLEQGQRALDIKEKGTQSTLDVNQARIGQLGASADRNRAAIEQEWERIKVSKDNEGKQDEKGQISRLIQGYKQLHPEQEAEPSEDQLHDFYIKFSKFGADPTNTGQMKAAKQAMVNLQKTRGYMMLDLSDPEDSAKADAMYQSELKRVTERFGGGGSSGKGGGMWKAPPPGGGTVKEFVGPGKYDGQVITTQEQFNQIYGGNQ